MKNFEIITEFRHCGDTVEIEKTNCKTLLSDPSGAASFLYFRGAWNSFAVSLGFKEHENKGCCVFKTQMSVTFIMAVPNRKKCWKSPFSLLDFFLQEIENKHTDSRRRNLE